MTALLGILIAFALFGVIVLAAAIRILREYERAVVFRLGRLLGAKGPGLVLLIPVIDRMVRVGLRTVTLRIPPQDVITRDNVPATVNAVAYFRVIDPGRAIVEVEDYMAATSQIAQTTLRSVLGKADLDILLSERERLNEDLQRIVDEQTEPWGVKVTTVEIKDVEIPSNMQRAMARQAEAERERRAKIINAEGEYQAAERLYQAATIISRDPAALQLRYLQTLLELGAGQTSTIVFPLPIDIIRPLTDAMSRHGGGNGPPHAPLPPANGGGGPGVESAPGLGSGQPGAPTEEPHPPGAAGHEGGPVGYRPGASPYSPAPGMDEPPPAEDRPAPAGDERAAPPGA